MNNLFKNQFIFGLEETLLEKNDSENINVPYGCFAVIEQDGKVLEVQSSGSFQNVEEKTNIFSAFFRSILEKAKNLIGQSDKAAFKPNIVIISNLKQLPVIEHEHAVNLYGHSEAKLKIAFWLDPWDSRNTSSFENIGLFIQNHVSGSSMSFDEFKKICLEASLPFLHEFDSQQTQAENQHLTLQQIENNIFKLIGVSSNVILQNGVDFSTKTIQVSQLSKEAADTGNQKFLLTRDGKQVIFKIRYESYSDSEIQEESVSNSIFSVLSHEIDKNDFDAVSQQSYLSSIELILNSQLASEFKNFLGNFEVLDIKEADSDWLMNTEAVVASELRKIQADSLMLEISDAKIDLDRASHAVARRKARQVYEEEVEARKIRVEKNQAHHELDLEEKKQDIVQAKDHLELDAELDEINDLKSQKQDEKSALEDLKLHQANLTRIEKEQELAIKGITAEYELEKIKATYDLEKKETEERIKQLESQTKALESDRDDAKQELKADAEQERQIKKMQQMGEIQAGLDKEDAALELERAQALKDLDPQTILALQAQKLLELGEDKEAANILKAIAENSNTKSDDQKEMYEKILEENKEMQKTLTDILLKNNQSMSKLAEKSLTGKTEPSAKPKIKNEKEQNEDKKNDS
ncbi:hypothetical protein OAD53_02870 [Gammaproteobacteria bacterium]|nr:hypothetical protein [Gammaproteobacteria bacterium]